MAGDKPDTPRKTRMRLSAQFASSRCLPLNSGMRGTLKNRGPWISLVLILLLAGIPWYWPESVAMRLYWGVPLWAWATMGSALAIAMLTAWAAMRWWPSGQEAVGDE